MVRLYGGAGFNLQADGTSYTAKQGVLDVPERYVRVAEASGFRRTRPPEMVTEPPLPAPAVAPVDEDEDESALGAASDDDTEW